ncbi:SDR family oxidoreductase [Saccharopolyspora sp. MS10]|uniref:SDR family oxidoreductase n=1 Tax=Saccharopolyspora sp. MS10 TaxID=3385973 RepID=UPI0039A16494
MSKVIVITGASSGIGEAAARLLAARGHRVFLGARREDRLARLTEEITTAGGSAAHRRLDVTDLDDVRAFVEAARAEFGRVDAILNNAGVMPLSPLAALKVDEWNRMIDVNVRGVLHGIAAALPVFSEQGGGHVINVSSVGGFQVSPTGAVYCATKFAVHALSEGLRQESDGSVKVTVISPGVTESELPDSITDETAREEMRTFRALAAPASEIAEAIAFALERPAGVDVNELVVRPVAVAA